MSDIIILPHSPSNFSGELRLINSEPKQVQFHSGNNESAVIHVSSKADADAGLVAVDIVPDYGYSIPRKIENIVDPTPLPLPAPDPRSYHLQARLAYENAVSPSAPKKMILSVSV
ncbi:hypothetical protein [Geomonas anaerohicana]|uniref:Uncharacterized protein n=1 Tax=Geomonas anaerohicana TaxID=2798583 RepID=A0ABS0YHS8_9BACT|nr:hypothetical protein [Geomonas anaerohicana]MBJ6751875.1 hypothetical protein [Geomonas anaerohicana]